MIYDIHTHYWNPEDTSLTSDTSHLGIPAAANRKMSSDRHFEETKAVDRAVVFGLRALKSSMNIPNDTVKKQVDRAPERLIFFTSIDPTEKGYLDELERTHMDLHAKGIKLGPIYQGAHPLDRRNLEIYAYAQKHNLPIVIHMATTYARGVPLDYARPFYMDEVAIKFPDLKMVLAHLGHPWIGETIAVIRRNPNLYADISALYYRPWQFYNAMQLLVEYGTWEKVFFGSDFPFTTPQESIDGIRNINHITGNSGLPRISDEIIDEILCRNSLGILGIE
ncbi:MAG: amidohydrolase [Candidatus Latescibacteria bacterium]|nr:amidohydrolase [Candidatus Latescibacterota bacterium]